ncbi:MAG: IspD/TarI family cytidylyltransferase [Verrucomicrobiota bacterium]
MSTVAIIVAAGNSRRMGFDKLTAPLAGLPVLAHSLLAFQNCQKVDHIIVVAADSRTEEFHTLAEQHGIDKLNTVVKGGAERCESVSNGIQTALKKIAGAKTILVHDGARPLIKDEAICQCINGAEKYGAASLAQRVSDTLKRTDESAIVTDSVERENLWRMETPQAFAADLIAQASRAATHDSVIVTDEVSAVQRFDPSQAIHLIENESANPKITLADDLPLAEALIKNRSRP